MPAQPTKSELRLLVRERLRNLTTEKAGSLRQRLAALPLLQTATVCVAYLAFQKEPNLDELLHNLLKTNKLLVIPRFCPQSNSYELAQITDLEEQTRIGHYSIREPLAHLPAIKELPENTCWLVPGLAFTEDGRRLGRGAGYYDRLFKAYPAGYRIGVAWECQILPEIPQEIWDCTMDCIVTEANSIDCRASFT